MVSQKKYLSNKLANISKWYNEIVEKAGLAEHAPVKGCMIIKPYGYALWENTQNILDAWFKKDGVQNAYFPIFIPYSLLQKEKKHISGFSPELAIVTTAGGEKLAQPLVVRPTSETIMYQTFRNWISSYKDLPLKINQWCNVVRWEKRTYLFLRTSEFLWQEGHTVHKNDVEAREMVMKALMWYKDFYEKYLAISVFVGEKSASERFAGAKQTFAIELVIPTGKALQGATSHNLGQNFSKNFDITYTDEQNTIHNPFQTSWGISTRSIGGLILSHGDDNGLILPPKIAPLQVIIFPIYKNDDVINQTIDLQIKRIKTTLEKSGIRHSIDERRDKTIGFRISESEIRGIPIRIEIGPAEIEKKVIIISRRDTLEKQKISPDNAIEFINESMEKMQNDLLRRSYENKNRLTAEVESFEEFKTIMNTNRQFIRAFWCESATCEEKIKEITKASTRVCELNELEKKGDGLCIYCNNKAHRKWLFAQSY